MQFPLFADQPAPTGEMKKTYGQQIKEKFIRERNYQLMKKESTNLQKKWENSQPAIKAQQGANRQNWEKLHNQPTQTVVLVACVSLKADEARQAQNLYISDWFIKARKYAEKYGDQWFILSAFYGLVSPTEVIEPYNQTLKNKRKSEREFWANLVSQKLCSCLPFNSKLIFLAGESYRSELIPLLQDRYQIEIPMKGLGIGQQLAFLKNAY